MAPSSHPKPGCMESISHAFQVWALCHISCNPIAWLILRFLSWYEGVRANSGRYLYHKRRVFGPNFCCAGGVWLGEFDEIERALTEPQARGYRLASSLLDPDHLPMKSTGGRQVFLLSLSNAGAGGNGDYEAFRSAVVDYLTGTEEAALRQGDATAGALLRRLASDYGRMGHTAEFFQEDPDSGHMAFLMRYLHYVIFGIDPNDEEKMETLTKFHYDSTSAAYHLKVVGNALGCLKFRGWPKMVQDVAKIYMESPAIAKFEEGNDKYNNMTKYELAMLMVSIMSLAGMVGPLTLNVIAMGHRPPNDYEGQDTGKIDVTKEWDKLDLDDREEVKRYIFECGRLRLPVSNTHRIATEPFTVTIRGKERTFPKGTTIFIPMILGMIDEAFWGPTTFKFDHNRENLCPYSMIFHSVGDRTNGRICPGREIALNMLTEVLIELGNVRRSN